MSSKKNEELEALNERLDEDPKVCSIQTSTPDVCQIQAKPSPDVCTIQKEPPDVCSIEKNSPDVCSIETSPEEKIDPLLENIKGLKRPTTCSIDTHQDISKHREIFEIEEEIPTFGRNVPATEEERKLVLEKVKKSRKPFKETDSVIKVEKNGPYQVSGNIPIRDIAIKINAQGQSIGFDDEKILPGQKVVYLCRCGKSKNMPFCDQTHLKIKFDGKCTADNVEYLEAADMYKGAEGIYLLDEESLCAIVRFCDPDGSCWNLVKSKKTVDYAEGEADKCCSGRLTLIIDDKLIEPEFEEEIQALFDTERDVLGPLWVKGGIPVKTDETDYERRNRVTLCRCGRSGNKPFCDGMHLTCPKVSPKVREEEE